MKQEVRLLRPADAFSKAFEISLRDCGERERERSYFIVVTQEDSETITI